MKNPSELLQKAINTPEKQEEGIQKPVR